jgi:hypothetical protein
MGMNESRVREIDKFLKWLKINKTPEIPLDHGDSMLFEGSNLWFRSDVEIKLRIILNEIANYSPEVQDFLKVGLSGLLKGMSNARMDSIIPTLPKETVYIDRKHYYREVDNSKRNIPVFNRLASQINRMKHAIIEFNKETNPNIQCNAYLEDARNISNYLSECNLVITSPPYWSAQNYEENQRLSFNLFNIRTQPGMEIGRDKERYLGEMVMVFTEISHILNGYFVIIIGEDKQKRMHDVLFQEILNCGLSHVDTAIRKISNQTALSKQITHEYIYVFRN